MCGLGSLLPGHRDAREGGGTEGPPARWGRRPPLPPLTLPTFAHTRSSAGAGGVRHGQGGTGAGRCGASAGEPGDARDTFSARYIAEKASLIGRAAPTSAAENGAATGGRPLRRWGGEGLQLPSRPHPPGATEALRPLRTPPPPPGAPAGSPCAGGGGGLSPTGAEYFALGRVVPVGWASGNLAAGGNPPPALPAPRRGAWLAAPAAAPRALAAPAGPVRMPLPLALPSGGPRVPVRSSVPFRAAPAGIARIAASAGRGTSSSLLACSTTSSFGRAGRRPWAPAASTISFGLLAAPPTVRGPARLYEIVRV